MRHVLERREFLAASAGIAAGLGLGLRTVAGAPRAEDQPFRTKLRKSMIVGKPAEEELKRLRDAGFEGVEASAIIDRAEAEACRAVAEKLGMRIHSVLRGWAEFNSPSKDAVEESFAVSERALRAAQGYGADAVLLVPCRIGGLPMPRPWEFHIDFDEATGHIRKVTAGDASAFEAYVRAHDASTDASREVVKRLIPVAEETKVVIALENVWNNLWVQPAIFRNLVASFKSPWVKAYFDIGNHVKYAAPESWILELGDQIVKCHVKDFRLNPSDPGGEGSFVNIRDGSVRWPVVRAALERVGYDGWMTIEGGDLSLEEHSKRLDVIIAGK